MDLKTIQGIIQLGHAGKTQYGIAKGLGLTQTVVAFILNKDSGGWKPQQILEQLTKQG